MMNALVSQGRGAPSSGRLGSQKLLSPWGREIDAYIFIRSFQEREMRPGPNGPIRSVEEALNARDPSWRERELIVLPSHVANAAADIDQMIEAAHGGGFDAVCATVIFTVVRPEDRAPFADIWRKPWDERWTIPNSRIEPEDQQRITSQVEALGRDLWVWICRALAS